MRKNTISSLVVLLGLSLVGCNSGGNRLGALGSNMPASAKALTATTAADNDNPFTGATLYVDPSYQDQVASFFAAYPAYESKAQGYMDKKGNWSASTSVWIDREAAIKGYKDSNGNKVQGINWHLTKALKQATSGTPTVITFVVYDLPDRDCAAYSSNGEIQDNGNAANVPASLNEYYHNYIDPFEAEISDFYQSNPGAESQVRVVLLVEPDALPNVITNSGVNGGSNQFPVCKFVGDNHVYTQGIEYALNKFTTSAYANSMTLYLDIGHEGWLGWDNNADQITKIYNNQESTDTSNGKTYGGLGKGFDKVRGFVVDTANTLPMNETFGQSSNSYNYYLSNNIISSAYYEWNDVYSIATYIAEIMSLKSDGTLSVTGNGHQIQPITTNQAFPNMHFIVDTGRNYWPTSNAMTYDAIDYEPKVTGSYTRTDIRHHTGNWCNVENVAINGQVYSPGLGELPVANPTLINPIDVTKSLPVDAYVWVKPPGTSDGNYNTQTGEGDQMCGTGDGGFHNESQPTDSLQGDNGAPAPAAGYWFDEAFKRLIDNNRYYKQ